ncbi:negative cofactor 2 transcription regulator complex subunit ncb2 [Boothiomyces macroporosus]|uniref:Negative cofactor 2 transcription regulator complex subunit ncb2 n=1 Tax=Boothiomyces macroporosus TaxID=261099 RepID=A0AAD5UMU9_9FUNG|nr:negative cofactor 2 transcription regulator complex subunit ncb2 [Boothiomyces macroporosus]
MDDDFDAPVGTNNDEDLSLPKATMAKLIQELLPSDMSAAKETRDLLTDCCVANDICEKENKKTIAGEHVISALKNLGFDDYVKDMHELLNEHQQSVKVDREKKSSRKDTGGLTEEELVKVQEEMFAKARERLQSGAGPVDEVKTEQ